MIDAPWLRKLASKAEIVSVCPEAEIGLGVPRKPINLVKEEYGVRVIQSETGLELNEELVSFSQGYLRFIGKVDAYVLKSRSPSCGLGTTKIQQNDGSFEVGSGVFAAYAMKFFPNAVFVDECFMEKKGVDALMDLINRY
jgi:uncharacterized protein YbbK (DUF523 family)